MIYPVILCGGSGTRLWPLSRKSYPKQFTNFLEAHTLFQATIERLSGPHFEAPLVITTSDFRFMVTEQLAEINVTPTAVVIEPDSRNTAPAILAAALRLQKSDPEALMLVSPSDHLIHEPAQFRDAVSAGVAAAKNAKLVTFGIQPTRAETGYGYLEVIKDITDVSSSVLPLKNFVEKPDLTNAQRMFSAGTFLWNAGIFLFSVKAIIKAFEKNAPDLIPPIQNALEAATHDLGFLRLAPDYWSQVENISIDYAIMEKADNLCAIPYEGQWSDVGGWDEVWRETKSGPEDVSISQNVTPLDCQNTLLRSEDPNMEVVGIGLKNIITVAMPDAVLVADMSRAQDVKKAVGILKKNSVKQAEKFPKDHRPWGWFENLAVGDRFQVKRIVVHPGAALSLQSHNHRSEHWVVVEGTAEVTLDDDVKLVTENQSVYIPLGAVHRMRNPGKIPLVLIEVQTGSYLGEDDITRYDDYYARQ
ncbi:MAG: mannose-1-phosphate guanylyltransferase/mannose-6-phosphate isomerase [Pseudohongiellaceae bacterium]